MSTLETNINSSINFAGDTAINDFAATGVNKHDFFFSKRCDVLEKDPKQTEQNKKLLEENILGWNHINDVKTCYFMGC